LPEEFSKQRAGDRAAIPEDMLAISFSTRHPVWLGGIPGTPPDIFPDPFPPLGPDPDEPDLPEPDPDPDPLDPVPRPVPVN
jgi:hypothetical protein